MTNWLGAALDAFRDFSEEQLGAMRSLSLLAFCGGFSLFAVLRKPHWFKQYSSHIPDRLLMNGGVLKGQVKALELENERICLQLLHRPLLVRTVDPSQVIHAKLFRVHYPSDNGFDRLSSSLLNQKVKFEIIGHNDHTADIVLFRRWFFLFYQNVNRALIRNYYANEDDFTLQALNKVKQKKYTPLYSPKSFFR